MPYTYLIGWTKLNRWYYGVRFAKTSRPDDLWKKYFTSSKRVKNIRKTHGESDVIQIRRVFESAQDAVNWEQRVLRKIHIKDPKWLNCNDGYGQFINKGGYQLTEEQKQVRRGKKAWNKGIKCPQISKATKGKTGLIGSKNPMYGKIHPPKWRKEHSEKMMGKNNPMFGKSAISGRKWFTNGKESVLVYPNEMPVDFVPGRQRRIKL